jgi:hypothetical protein
MTSDVGKVIMQFRSFVAVAWAKQTVHGFHMRDAQTLIGWSAAVLLGGLSYVAQTVANSVGHKDADSFLEERLSMDNIAAAAFNRAGWASLMPMGVDAIWTDVLRFHPIFRYGRTSGLASNPLGGNPTADLVFNAAGRALPSGILAPILNPDEGFTQKDARGILGAAVFGNALGVRNVTNWLLGDVLELPE